MVSKLPPPNPAPVRGGIYQVNARNFGIAVSDGGITFVGIRLKFDRRFLDTEQYDYERIAQWRSGDRSQSIRGSVLWVAPEPLGMVPYGVHLTQYLPGKWCLACDTELTPTEKEPWGLCPTCDIHGSFMPNVALFDLLETYQGQELPILPPKEERPDEP